MSVAYQNIDRIDENAELDGIPIRSVLGGLARLHQLVIVCSSDGRVLWMSDALDAICGDREDFVGTHFHDLLVGLTDEFDEILRALLRGEHLSERSLRIERSDGRPPLTAALSAFAIPSEYGDSALLVGIVRPCEGSAEQATPAPPSEEQQALSALLDASPDAIVAVDEAGFVTYANRGAEDVLGRPRTDLRNRPLALLMSGADGFGQLMADQRSSAVSDRDLRITRPDGKRVLLSVSSRPLVLPDGRRLGTAAYLRDVTEREDLAAQLKRKAEELEGYVHTVSHDLRSPLVAVLGFARLLREDYANRLDADGARFLDRIEQGARTMDALVHDLLELSRIGNEARETHPVDATRVLRQLAAELKPRLESHDMTLTFENDAPPLACGASRLYQVLSNLLENAIRHAPADRETRPLTIEVTIDTLPDLHRICVRDDGVGIAPENHARIFEVFQTIGDRVRIDGQRSSGMGLAIVKKIAESHGGSAWVESTPGGGASFYVTMAAG